MDPEAASVGPGRGLFPAVELLPADGTDGGVEGRLVIPAVVAERRRILEQNPVIVRERVGRKEIPPPDLDRVEPQLPGGKVQQPLHDEHPMLPSRAPHRRDDGTVGEDGAELALVVGNLVLA
jgi:hypothetical protein